MITTTLSKSERHELECLRAQIKQIEYPCSPHCAGYLRELALRNSGSIIDNAAVNRALNAYYPESQELDWQKFDNQHDTSYARDMRSALEAFLNAPLPTDEQLVGSCRSLL